MRRLFQWARGLVWLAVLSIVCLVGAAVAYLCTGDPVWPLVLVGSAVTLCILSLRET